MAQLDAVVLCHCFTSKSSHVVVRNASCIVNFELMAIQPESSPTGYIIECDLVYPDKLHDKHSDYLLAPDHLTVVDEMLSPYSRNLINPNMMWKPSKKLVPNLLNKTQ